MVGSAPVPALCKSLVTYRWFARWKFNFLVTLYSLSGFRGGTMVYDK